MAFELLEPMRGSKLNEKTGVTMAVHVNTTQSTPVLSIIIHSSVAKKLCWKKGERVQILYDIKEKKVMLRRGEFRSFVLRCDGNTENLTVRRSIVHGEHQEPLKPKKMMAKAATSCEVTKNGELIFGVPEQED